MFAPGPFAVWFALLLLVGFPDVVFGTGSFVLRDFNGFGFPLAAYHKASIWRGELPFWNPLSYGGVPHLAQWNTLTLYPGSLIYLLLPLPVSLGWFCLLHLYLGGVGAYRLARRWWRNDVGAALAGVAFAWSGLAQNSLMWPNNIAALGWMPWTVLTVWVACEAGRRSLLIAVAVASLQMLSGAPEVILFTWTLIVGRFAWSPPAELLRRGRRLAGVIAGTTGVCAMQLLPFFDLLGLSRRVSHGQGMEWAADPFFWTSLFVPIAGLQRFANDVCFHPGQGWTHSFYHGLPVLLLALGGLLARPSARGVAAGLVFLFGALLSLGDKGPFYGWLSGLLPLGIMRFPVKFQLLGVLLMPMLAARGWSVFEASWKSGSRWWWPWMGSACLIVAGLVCAVGRIGVGAELGEVSTLSALNAVERVIWVGIAAGLLVWCRRSTAGARTTGMQLALVLVVWWDLKTHQPGMTPRVKPALFTMENPDLAALNPFPSAGRGRIYRLPETRWRTEEFDDDSLDRRLMRSRLELSPNLNLPEGMAMFDGFLSLWLPMFDGIGSMLWRREGGLNEELADFLSITHTTSTNAFGAWPIRPTAHPWVTAGQRPRFVTPDEALQRISKGWWDAEREVFLSRGTSGSITAGEDRTARLGELRFESQRVGFEVTAAVDTMVVVAQLHHPGWRASVDGNEVKIWPANLGFQAMEVPAGHHVVELRYVERWFVPGLGVSAVTILLLAGLGWRWRRSPGCPPHVSQG